MRPRNIWDISGPVTEAGQKGSSFPSHWKQHLTVRQIRETLRIARRHQWDPTTALWAAEQYQLSVCLLQQQAMPHPCIHLCTDSLELAPSAAGWPTFHHITLDAVASLDFTYNSLRPNYSSVCVCLFFLVQTKTISGLCFSPSVWCFCSTELKLCPACPRHEWKLMIAVEDNAGQCQRAEEA